MAAGADVTVAVSLSDGGPSAAGAAPVQESAEPRPNAEQRVADQTQEEVYGELPPGLRTVTSCASRSMRCRASTRGVASPATRRTCLVAIPRDACRTLDFHRAGETIELGRTRAAEALDSGGPFDATIPPGAPSGT